MPAIKMSNKNPSLCFMLQAEKTPDKKAVVDYVNSGERHLTFKQLENRIQSLASYFVNSGICVDDRIAIVSQNRIEIAETFLAAMRIGAVPFSINPHLSMENIEHVFQDSKPAFSIIETEKMQPTIAAAREHTKNPVILLDSRLPSFLYYDDLLKEACNNLPIYSKVPRGIIYTSGSTGRPKGVLKKLENYEKEYPSKIGGIEIYASESEFLNTPVIVNIPLFHASGLGSIWSVLPSGGALIIMRYFDPSIYLKMLSEHHVKISWILPNMLSMCLKEESLFEQLNFTLKVITVIGGACSPDTLHKAENAFKCRVLSMYGMTEGGPELTYEGFDIDKMPSGSCGKAIKGELIKLVDSSGKEGDFGEMWFKNDTLFEKYYNRPDLMEDRYEAGWFKTRDIFYRDDNNFFFHKGRSDDMFVCDGENIYPQEIENILGMHKAVLISCVVSLDHKESGQVPAAMVVCRDGYVIKEDELRTHYLRNGPLYAYPRIIKIVDELPILGPGKVNRPEIRKILGQSLKLRTSSVTTGNDFHHTNEDIETLVMNVWKDILKMNSLKPTDNVFDLGVNSIQITLFCERVSERLHISIALDSIFEAQKIDDIVHHLKYLINIGKIPNSHNNASIEV